MSSFGRVHESSKYTRIYKFTHRSKGQKITSTLTHICDLKQQCIKIFELSTVLYFSARSINAQHV